jgi:hypothetical protein
MDNPQIIRDDEIRLAFVVIPVAEYKALLEQADEVAD